MFTKMRNDVPQVFNKPKRETTPDEVRLLDAVAAGDLAIIRSVDVALLRKTRDNRESPYERTLLMVAAAHGKAEVVDYLLKIGLEVNATDIARYGDKNRPNWDGANALHYALSCGPSGYLRRDGERPSYDVVKLLLEAKININVITGSGYTSLGIAARLNDLKGSRLLLEAGADISLRDNYSCGLIGYACLAGSVNNQLVKLLIKVGASPNVVDKSSGESDFLLSFGPQSEDLVLMLLDAGADPFIVGKLKMTSLMKAARFSMLKAAKRLLAMGVDKHAKDKDGLTAHKIAKQEKNKAMILLLS